MPNPIILSKDATFYLAICKHQEHTWLTLGAAEPQGAVHTLAYFGKRLAYKKDYGCSGRLTTLFGTVPGVLTRDYKFKTALNENKKLNFEYKAYEISRENYLEFAQHMRQIVANKYSSFDEETKNYHKNELYYPSTDNPYQFEFIPIEQVPNTDKSVNIHSDVTRLGVKDNCRHTALDLLKECLDLGKKFAQGISSFAYACLPFKAVYHQDKIEGYFYVLPTPPSTESSKDPLLTLQQKIFGRLSEIPNLKSKSSQTYEKFIALKALYQELSIKKSDNPLNEALTTITNWESKHAKTIDQCRLFHTKRTKTRQLMDEAKTMLSAGSADIKPKH